MEFSPWVLWLKSLNSSPPLKRGSVYSASLKAVYIVYARVIIFNEPRNVSLYLTFRSDGLIISVVIF